MDAKKVSTAKVIMMSEIGTVNGLEKVAELEPKETFEVGKMTWSKFTDVVNYSQDYKAVSKLLSVIMGIKENRILRMPVTKTLPMFQDLSNQFRAIMKTLQAINSELPSGKTAKDMSEFGLYNITNFICKAKKMSRKEVEELSVYEIIFIYKNSVYEQLNALKSIKK